METKRFSPYLLLAVSALEACGGSNAMPAKADVLSRTAEAVSDAGNDFVPAAKDEVECRISGTREKVMTCCIDFDSAATSARSVCWRGTPQEMEKGHKGNLLLLPNDEQVVGYPQIKDQVPEDEYVKYLMRKLSSAEDVVHLIDQIITYTQDEDNLLYPAMETLRNGAGDCDNMSNLAKFLLVELGKKNGHNYDPRIVTLPGSNHAVMVFRDSDGKWKSLDQHPPLTVISDDAGQVDLLSASELFNEGKGDQAVFREVVQLDNEKHGRGSSLSFGVDSERLMPNEGFLAFFTSRNYDANRDPSAVQPADFIDSALLRGADWKKMEELQLQFGDATVFYEHGVIRQFQHAQQLWDYVGGKLVQKDYKDPASPVEKEYFDQATGDLKQKNYRNGIVEFFKNGRVHQRQYESGDLDADFFDESGALVQRSFRDGRVEWYDSAGKVIQRKDEKGHVERVQ